MSGSKELIMNRNEAIQKLEDEVTSIIAAVPIGTGCFYNGQQKSWSVNTRFSITNPIPCKELEKLFNGYTISYSKMRKPNTISVSKKYDS